MSEILSQEEIDALLAALNSGEIDPGEIRKEAVEQRVKLYDFKRPEKFTKEQMRTLQMIHENLARSLTTYLAATLRTVVDIKVVSVQQLSYYEFTRSLPVLTIMSVFSIPEWEGRALVESNPSLVFAVIDRILGGPGIPPDKPRPLTDIEQGIVQQIMRQIAVLAQEAWRTVASVQFNLDSLETNPLFTQIVSQNETVALVTCSARIGSTEGMVNICLPHMVLERVMDKLTTRSWFAGQTHAMGSRTANRVQRRIQEVALPVLAQLGATQITVSDLLGLQIGDCIKLDARVEGQIKVFVGPFPKFQGRIGLQHRQVAVQVESLIAGGDEDGS